VLPPHTRFGPYEILEHIGSGGMGDVYRALDTRLDRSVAIKVLPAQHADLRARMAREARAISGVSHPNICALYDVGSEGGVDYLVMEYLEGETLAAKLARGPLPIAQALKIGADIAGALDVAHRAGVIHRDLKPHNIVLTKSGAKLLDFGLAKNVTAVGPDSPTVRHDLTEPGMVVGTLQYMSPEQLESHALDTRTDIFSFGCVLYEMATGRRAFGGDTRASVITAILTRQPEAPSAIRDDVPPAIDRVVARCLEKDADDRWQSARDLSDELRWIAQDRSSPSQRAANAARGTRRVRWPQALAIVSLLVALGALAYAFTLARATKSDGNVLRFTIAPPAGAAMSQRATNTELAVSPDGTRIAMSVLESGSRKLLVRAFSDLAFHELEGTGGGLSPFWSPDGKWIGFFANGDMKKVPADGGAVEPICRARGGTGAWSANGDILFCEWGPGATDALQIVSSAGGAPRAATDDARWYMWPQFLADGTTYIATANGKSGAGIVLGSLTSKSPVLVGNLVARPEIDDADNVYFVRDGALVRQHLDRAKKQLSGDAVQLLPSIYGFGATGAANFSVSRDGRVVVAQRMSMPTQLVWRDRAGHDLGHIGTPQRYRKFRLSPDGARLALEITEAGAQQSNIWIHDVVRGIGSRLTSTRHGATSAVWTFRGDAIYASVSDRDPWTAPQISRVTLDTGAVEPRTVREGPAYVTSVAAGDTVLVYTVSRGRHSDIETIPAKGPATPTPLLHSEFNERDAAVSRDDRWMAFESDDSGRPEIYVMPFQRPGERTRVSADGGSEPRWSADGRTLYYINAAGMLMAAEVAANGTVGAQVPLFAINSASMLEQKEFGATHYDVDSAHDRFLVRELLSSEEDPPLVAVVKR
jgi:Tol biopolymer transport system component